MYMTHRAAVSNRLDKILIRLTLNNMDNCMEEIQKMRELSLIEILTSVDTNVAIIKECIAKKGTLDEELTLSLKRKIRNRVQKLPTVWYCGDGYHYIDEFDVLSIRDHLFEIIEISEDDKEGAYIKLCYEMQKRINEFYKILNQYKKTGLYSAGTHDFQMKLPYEGILEPLVVYEEGLKERIKYPYKRITR